MARYRGPVCKLCRREGEKLFLKGERCQTVKCAVEKKNYPPGQHGKSRRIKVSDYGVQLREKQKIKRYYGLLESQFRETFERASRKKGITIRKPLACLISAVAIENNAKLFHNDADFQKISKVSDLMLYTI